MKVTALKNGLAITCLVVLLVATAAGPAAASELNWRLNIFADDGAGSNGSYAQVGIKAGCTDPQQTDSLPLSDSGSDSPWTIGLATAKAVAGVFATDTAGATLRAWAVDLKSTNQPWNEQYHDPVLGYRKVWTLRVAGCGTADTATAIRLRFLTVSSALLPSLKLTHPTLGQVDNILCLKMVDNRGQAGAPANGTVWRIPIPTSHSATPAFTLTLPTINISVARDEQKLIAEGYVMEFYQTVETSGLPPGICISAPSAGSTTTGPVSYTVTYSLATDVSLSPLDVTLNKTGTANGSVSVTGTGNDSRTVTISGITGNGTLGITIAPGTASNADGSASGAGPSTTFDVENEPPVVQFTFPTTDDSCTRNCSELDIAGTATGQQGISTVQYTLNGGTAETCDGTTDWSATGLDLEDGENAITVTATDSSGNSGSATLTVTYTDSMPGDAWQGVAMVSLPIIPDETDPKTSVGFDQNRWYLYDTLATQYAAYPDPVTWFDPADSAPGRGFWAYFPSGGGASPRGNIPPLDEAKTIHLYRGWNLIGQPFIKDLPWDMTAIQVKIGEADPLPLGNSRGAVSPFAWGWNPVAHSYYLVADPAYLDGAVGVMSPWQGYWLKAYTECDLILPPPQQEDE